MSASLVGSEMCIRDSGGPHHHGLASCHQVGALPGRAPEVPLPLPVAGRAVSYTHLTLPTICSV
eukprot:5587367-Alexandrium_andersonii.AAC.1